MSGPILAVLGGSGLYDVEAIEGAEECWLSTPYGAPSDAVLRGRMKGTDTTVLFLPRHGRGHRLPPSAINYRANVCALKLLGATHVLSVSAVGSMREAIAPGDMVVVDQFIDLTKRRIGTFFDEQVTAHVAFADPVCPILSASLHGAAKACIAEAADPAAEGGRSPQVHRHGTYVCMEGPQFSTRAESRLYRTWGVDVIGMTNMPEAKLAREAELPYATLAMATDYDCWHTTEESVSVEAIVATLRRNVALAQRIVQTLARALPDVSGSPAQGALRNAIMTAPKSISPEQRSKLGWLIGPYLAG